MVKHDAQGFLVGDPIDLGQAIKDWSAIRQDVRAIRDAVQGVSITLDKAESATKIATPTERSAKGGKSSRLLATLPRYVAPKIVRAGENASQRSDQKSSVASQAAAVRAVNQAMQEEIVKPASRDRRGRFVRGGDGSAPRASGADGGGEGALRSIADRIVGAVKESGSGMEEADPTVKAFNEVAQPMARGYEMMTGGNPEKKQEGWLRRIWTSLTGFRKDETAFNKAANKSLKNIEEKPGDGEPGGPSLLGNLLGGLGGMLSRIPLVGGALAAGGRLLGGVGKGVMGAGRGLMGMMGKGVLRRIPLIGAMLGGIGAASDIYDSETDNSLSRREKDQRDGKAVGGLAGTLGGMFAGAKLGAMAGAFAGPVGAAIGGAVGGAAGLFFGDQAGQIIGTTVGGWVSDLRDADIPGRIGSAWAGVTAAATTAWDGITGMAKSFWDGLTTTASSTWEGIKNAANGVNDAIKEFAGIDIKGMIGGAVDLLSRAADSLGSWVAEKTGKAWGSVKTAASNVGGFVADTLNNSTIGKGVNKVIGAAREAYNWNDQKKTLTDAAYLAGGDAKLASVMAMSGRFESGFDPTAKAKGSSAFGIGQFTDATWADSVKKWGGKYGIAGKETPEQMQAIRNDPRWQSLMLAELTKENMSLGRKYAGAAGTDDAANVYAMHNLGGGDGKRFLGALNADKNMSVTDALVGGRGVDPKEADRIRRVIEGNPSLYREGNRTLTVGESYARMSKAMHNGDKYAAEAASIMQGGTQIATASAPQAVIAQVNSPKMPTSVSVPAAPVIASSSAPPISVAPRAPSAVAEAPPVTIPMASGDSSRPIVVAAQSNDVGQDLRDRRIAHVATGGIA